MRAEKHQLVHDIKELLGLSTGFFLIGYKGLTTAALTDLRGRLAAVGGQCHIVPNRLFKRAAAAGGISAIAPVSVAGDNAVVCGGDLVAVAKIVRDFAKSHDKAPIRLGVVSGQVITADQVGQLADLPPREVLLAQLLGVLQAPASNLARVLNAKLASVVYVLNAHLKNKEQAA
jgi:large subunit ribosomal protein L10